MTPSTTRFLFILFSSVFSQSSAFLSTPSLFSSSSTTAPQLSTIILQESKIANDITSYDRKNFLSTLTQTTVAVTGTALLITKPEEAQARGRATLEQSYDRYVPRIEAGGKFYANDLRRAVEKADWAAIKEATAEPPKRSKEDKSKIDGGVSERASKAGGFSAARVLTAAELWAAAFSDNSISNKTKKMKDQVAILKEVVSEMSSVARVALGEEKTGGGFLGLGAKKPSQSQLAQQIRDLYVKGGNAWNQYIYEANDELPVQLKKIPYL